MIILETNNEQIFKDRFSPEKIKEKTVVNGIHDEKTATNNQWVSTGLKPDEDKRDRRDGPGGEGIDE